MMKETKKRKSSSIASFKLESLPPTTAPAKYQAYRAYFAVQEWLGNSLQATDWGWEYNDEMLSPVYTDRPVVSDSVLNMVSYGCKTNNCMWETMFLSQGWSGLFSHELDMYWAKLQ